MSTSGVANYSDNLTSIVTDAMNLIGAAGDGTTIQVSDYNLCIRFLNDMMKYWAASGICVWCTGEAYVFPALGQVSYKLGASDSPGGDNATTSANFTSLSVAAITGATTITCTSVSGMSANDNIGILLSDNTRQWTTIVSINTGTQVVTLNTALTNSAKISTSVYSYTTKMADPVRVLSVRRHYDNDPAEINLPMIERSKYFQLPDRTTTGTIVQWYYQRLAGSGTLYVWQPASSANLYLSITYLRDFQDMINATDTPDFPQEWFLAIKYNLATIIAPAFGKAGSPSMQYLNAKAMEYLDYARTFDQEQGTYYLTTTDNQGGR